MSSKPPAAPTARPFAPPSCLAKGYLHIQEAMGAVPTLPVTPPRAAPANATDVETNKSPLSGSGAVAGDVPLLVTFQGRETDVSKSTTQRVLRRFSSGLKLRQFSRRYFELSGHSLCWYESEEDAKAKGVAGACGYYSLLACEGVRMIGPCMKGDSKAPPPHGTYGGFELVDAAKGEDARGDLVLFAETQAAMDDWIRTLTKTHELTVRHPLSELGGPIQAAQVKPLIQGELLSRDTLDGIALSSWSNLLVLLFDSRIEFHSVSSSSSKTPSSIRTCKRLYWLTKDFYVADSRVRSNAFVVTDGMLVVYLCAKDSRTKLFWMESIAKALVKLGTMTEHVDRVVRALSVTNRPSQETMDDDSDDEEDEKARRAKLPPQLSDAAIRSFYSPSSLPPSTAAAAAASTSSPAIDASAEKDEDSSTDGEEEDVEAKNRKARKSYIARMKDDSPLVATPIEQRSRGSSPLKATPPPSASTPNGSATAGKPIKLETKFSAASPSPPKATTTSGGSTALASKLL